MAPGEGSEPAARSAGQDVGASCVRHSVWRGSSMHRSIIVDGAGAGVTRKG